MYLDYHPLRIDSYFNVIDEYTQLPPHLMDPGPLVNLVGQIYENQPPSISIPNEIDSNEYEYDELIIKGKFFKINI